MGGVSVELKCPFCLWPITADEAVETCGHCAARYHRECWIENQGCGTFGCPAWATTQTGGAAPPPPAPSTPAVGAAAVVVVAEPEPEPTRPRFCDRCGEQVTPVDRFCGGCGNTL